MRLRAARCLEALLARSDANAYEPIADRALGLEDVDAPAPSVGEPVSRESSAAARKRQAAGADKGSSGVLAWAGEYRVLG